MENADRGDFEIDYERIPNAEAIDDDGADALVAGILDRARLDYLETLKVMNSGKFAKDSDIYKNAKKLNLDVRRFVHGKWFEMLLDTITGDEFLALAVEQQNARDAEKKKQLQEVA